jgi:Tfp pilus assembly protein PilV
MSSNHKTYNWLFWVLKASRLHPSQGLSLGEVLIASVVSTLFFLVSLQCALLGGQYQKQSLDTSQYNRLVQTDLEQSAQNQADQYSLARLTAPANPGATTLSVSSVASFTNADWVIFANDFDRDTLPAKELDGEFRQRFAYRIANVNVGSQQITLQSPIHHSYNYPVNGVVVRGAEPITTLSQNVSNGNLIRLTDASSLTTGSQLMIGNDDRQIYTVVSIAGQDVTIRPPLADAHFAGALVGTSRCVAKTSDRGFAAGLQGFLNVGNDPQTISQTGQYGEPYRFQRTMSIINQSPFNVLRVQYEVQTRSQPYTFTTDIIPSASLYCS